MSDMAIHSYQWDRTLLHLSSQLTTPFCEAWRLLRYRMVAPLDPNVFENYTSKIKEISFRCLVGIGTCAAAILAFKRPCRVLGAIAGLGIGSKALRALGFALQTNDFTHVSGNAIEKREVNPELKLMTWNICGLAGGFSLDHGGVVDWRLRIEEIVKTIREESPDVLLLQEVVDTDLAETLIEKLKDEFAHFFIHLGKNTLGVGSGCMVLSKAPIHDFSYTPFSTNTWDLNRGFATLELKKSKDDPSPCVRLIGTHLMFGNSEQSKNIRMKQIAEIVNAVAQKNLSLPTVVAGDLNIERDLPDGKFLSESFVHGYTGKQFTCTNQLAAQWNQNLSMGDEMIDYISILKTPEQKEISLSDVHVVSAFDEDLNTKTARSDHHALVANIHI